VVDTEGEQDEYSIMNSKHFIGIHGYMLVYSVSSVPSFEMVQIIRDKILHALVRINPFSFPTLQFWSQAGTSYSYITPGPFLNQVSCFLPPRTCQTTIFLSPLLKTEP
jgi:hypothetical protein